MFSVVVFFDVSGSIRDKVSVVVLPVPRGTILLKVLYLYHLHRASAQAIQMQDARFRQALVYMFWVSDVFALHVLFRSCHRHCEWNWKVAHSRSFWVKQDSEVVRWAASVLVLVWIDCNPSSCCKTALAQRRRIEYDGRIGKGVTSKEENDWIRRAL